MYEWYINEWVHLIAIHPETKEFHYFKEGIFSPYSPLTKEISTMGDAASLFESAPEMETNKTIDATQENLPVLTIP